MKPKTSGYFRLFIVTVLLIKCLSFTYPTMRNIFGLMSLDEVSSMKDAQLYEGNYVKVTYDCVLDGYYDKYIYFWGNMFNLLRMPDQEEYLFSTVPTNKKRLSEWEGCDYFVHASDSIGFIPENKHYFVGRVERLSVDERRILSKRMKSTAKPEYTMINTEENTNMIYYVNRLNMKTEISTLIKKVPLDLVVFAIWIRKFNKIKEMKEDELHVYTRY